MSQTHLSYTSRDFESIKADLVNAIPNLTDIWTSREEADPGMVLITLMAALGDNLSFNMDQQSLEFYGKTFTQRKNAARVLDLIVYKLHWYKSATIEVTVYNTNTTNKAYLVFNPAGANTQKLISSSISSAPSYFLLNPDETAANWDKTTRFEIPAGGSKTLQAVQGTLNSVSFDASAIDINNRYYFSTTKIDQAHIWLKDSAGFQWYLVDNINNLTETAPRFEFGVDEYNLPYIELVPYWKSTYGEVHTFTVYYLVTRGSTGNIAANILNRVAGIANNPLNNGRIKASDILVVHGANTVPNTKLTNIPGADPQTAREAYYDSRNYIGVYNTLVTLQDFEKYMLRLNLISAVKAVDGQYAKEYNETLSDEESYNKLYPISYVADSYSLSDGTYTYNVVPYTGDVVKYYNETTSVFDFHLTDPEAPGTWFKADTHTYEKTKYATISSEGAENKGSLLFVHNGSPGDLRVGLNPYLDENLSGITPGNKRASFLIKFENLPIDKTDLNKYITSIGNLKLLFEEPGYESLAIDLLPFLTSSKTTDIQTILQEYVDNENRYTTGYLPVINVPLQIYNGHKCYFRLIYTPSTELAANDQTPIVSINIDQFLLDDTLNSGIIADEADQLHGLGKFCSEAEMVQLHTTNINGVNYIFYVGVSEDDPNDCWVEFYQIEGQTNRVSIKNDVVTLSVKDEFGKYVPRTFFFQKASELFPPYNLQLHMVAGDFVVSDPTQTSYTYAEETPVTVTTDESGPQGYISYQLTDTVVGPNEDSMISQTNFDDVRLYNTEILYGPIRKFPFFIDGQIHLKSPVRPAEANLILGRVFTALQTYFNAYNLTLGEKITFNDIIAVIKSADENIDYFDAGANNQHGSLFIYPSAEDYNPNIYNPNTETYGKYEVNINPKYFNDISMQHYEDMLQANNSIIYWGDTLSKHLSIAEESILEKSVPLTSGISAVLSYDTNSDGLPYGVVSPDPDVVNLYEYNIIKNAIVDVNHKPIVSDIPNEIVVRKYEYFKRTGTSSYQYYVDIPLEPGEDLTVFEHSPAFRFTLNDVENTSLLFGFSDIRNDFAILNAQNIPTVVTDISPGEFIDISVTKKNKFLHIEITGPSAIVSQNTKVYYLVKYKPDTHVSYFKAAWSENNIFEDIKNIGLTDSNDGSQRYSILYETLTDTDHIWGSADNQDYISLNQVGCDYNTVYDLFDTGFVAALRSKETLTSKPSAVVLSNYAVIN